MYADRITAGSKRSIRDRLNIDLPEDLGRSRKANSKRQRQSDDRWKHDLYGDDREPQTSKSRVGPGDLRFKLQKKASEQVYQGARETGVRDLREKLSGTMHSQPPNTDLPKAKPVYEVVKPIKKSALSVEARVSETKKSSPTSSSRKKSQQKDLVEKYNRIVLREVCSLHVASGAVATDNHLDGADLWKGKAQSNSSVDSFIRSVGLEKYLILFQAEEIDMTVLMQMTDDDLKALGIPMGPRKKILLALESSS